MLPSYKRRATIAAAVFMTGIIGNVVLVFTGHKDLWDKRIFGHVSGLTLAASYLYALLAHVRGKGRSPAWVLMALLNVIGLIVLLMLEDLHKESSASETPPAT
jgi:hypothetical protein